jgi:DNA-binding protein HU-beta
MSLKKQELIRRVGQRVNQDEQAIEEILDATLEEIYQSLKRGESVNFLNFGTFYIQFRRTGTVFKFNPSQRLRKLFGWSSKKKSNIRQVCFI